MGITKKITSRVVERYWGPGDYYLVLPLSDIQVFKEDGFKEGERYTVTLTIKKENEL